MDSWERLLLYRKKLILPRIYQVLGWVMWVTYFFAILFLATLVYEHGFMISPVEAKVIRGIYQAVWIVFLLSATIQIIFQRDEEGKKNTFWAWIINVLLYLTLLPVVFKKPDAADEGVFWIWTFFHSHYYRIGILLLYSLLQLSSSLVRLLGRRTNPSLILASSFLVIIFIGAGLLMLPRATCHGISWIDALFTATSATCVTGLVSVDVPSTFTLEGQIIIILLIQIGGLGVMTLTSFFAMFFMGNTSLYNQLVVGDMISSNSLNSLLSTLLYILGFTLAIEGIGMVVIWFSIHDTLGMTLQEELYFAAFHSVSAFCNAGFSTLPGNLGNPAVMQHNLLFMTVSFLIILGGIGFPILVNLKETLFYYLRYLKWFCLGRSSRFPKQVHLYNLNTRIVLIMTAILLVFGTLAIALYEWNHAFAGMSVTDKWVHAFFNATCPRTAGFTSVGLTTLSTQTLLLMIALMIIGGGTQSTAGGVKINVFAVILLNLWAVIRGANRVTIFHRELSDDSIRRSNAVLMLYLILLFAAIFVMSLLEPEASVMALTFECVSALSTVGSSLDLTPVLSTAGKSVIILLMFIGRVGAFTLLLGLVKQVKKRNYKYPSDNIIIN